MAELVVGTRVSVSGLGSFQNYDLNGGSFAPFAFSGAIHSATGDNVPASLTFPANEITVSMLAQLIRDRAMVTVTEIVGGREVFRYNGQAVGGGMSEVDVTIQLSSFLDAVTAEFPWKFLTEDLVGPLPTSSRVSVR